MLPYLCGARRWILYFKSRFLTCVFEHANSLAISRIERRSARYFCLSTFSGMNREVVEQLDTIENCRLSTDSAQWLLNSIPHVVAQNLSTPLLGEGMDDRLLLLGHSMCADVA